MNDESFSVVNNVSEFKGPEVLKDKGVLERIVNSKSKSEADQVFELGKTFKNVSVKTMKKWAKAYSAKLSELNSK